MKRSLSSSLRTPAGVVVVAIVMCGCSPRQGKVPVVDSDSLGAPDSALLNRRGATRSSIIQRAESLYTYGPDRPQLMATDSGFPGVHVPDGAIPRMWIATARWKGVGPRPRDRILARIRSEGPYPAMGIAAGYNYVSRNSWDSKSARYWQTQIVARDGSVKAHALMRDRRLIEYTHGDSLEPRLVVLKVGSIALGLCLDDPICRPMGHCGYY